MTPVATLPPVRAVFRAVVVTVAPRAGSFGPGEWARAEELVEEALRQRPPAIRRQIRLFLRVIHHLPRIRYGRSFPRLSPERRLRVLQGLESAGLLLVRRGVWGVRTLAYLAVYGQDPVRERIGYRADPRGWQARPGAATAATHGGIQLDPPSRELPRGPEAEPRPANGDAREVQGQPAAGEGRP